MAEAIRRKILLTGPPGCGKTTVIRQAARILGERARGFYTEEVRDARGQRTGFDVVSLDGRRGELARKSPGRGPHVGSYRVDVGSFERIALASMEPERGTVLVIDEIGKMECHSAQFVRAVERVFDGNIPILATVPLRGRIALVESIRRRADVVTIVVTTLNRESLAVDLGRAFGP